MKTLTTLFLIFIPIYFFAQKVSVKDVDDHILVEIIDEDTSGSISILPGPVPSIVNHKLYNVENSLYWGDTKLGTVFNGGGWINKDAYIYPADLTHMVGIGTSDFEPHAMLQVNRDNEGTNSIDPVALFRTTGEGSSAAAIRFQNSADNSWNIGVTKTNHNAFAINYNSNISQNSDFFRIKPDGNVGIGTVNPISKLEVGGSTDAVSLTIRNATGAGTERLYFGNYVIGDAAGITVHGSGNPGSTKGRYEFFNDKTGAYFYWKLNGFPKMIMDNAGNLGIGTIEPYAKLHIIQPDNADALRIDTEHNVSRTLKVDANGNLFVDGLGSFPQIEINNHEGSGHSLFIEDEASDTSPFVIDAIGNIGIGVDFTLAKMELLDDLVSIRFSYEKSEWPNNSKYGIQCEDSQYGLRGNLSYRIEDNSGWNQNYGVQGSVDNTGQHSNIGVYGYARGGNNNIGVYGSVGGDTGSKLAGLFAGDVVINDSLEVGHLIKSGGSFRIDHPLDPANKYLFHSFVESPDMMNIYNGNVILDNQGQAVVEMPDWFDALNKHYRYQLTAIGAPGPNLYIAEKISGNRFSIAGGAPGMEVSWQVTGIRDDAYARQNRIKVEVAKKPANQGTYLNPKAFGKPETMKEGYDRLRFNQ